MSTVDDILELLDNSLQEPLYFDVCDYNNHDRPSACWRCESGASAPDSPSGLCSGCRAWMANESDEDPKEVVDLYERWISRRPPLDYPLYHVGIWPSAYVVTDEAYERNHSTSPANHSAGTATDI